MYRFDRALFRHMYVSEDGKDWRRLTFIENLRFIFTGVIPYGR